jgi:hypothetical protein
LINVSLNVACTNLNANGTRRHIRAALDAGATREEILMVFKMASVISIHSCNLGASILLEEATTGLLDAASDERLSISRIACINEASFQLCENLLYQRGRHGMKTLEAHHFKLCRMECDCRCQCVARVHRAAVSIQPEAR